MFIIFTLLIKEQLKLSDESLKQLREHGKNQRMFQIWSETGLVQYITVKYVHKHQISYFYYTYSDNQSIVEQEDDFQTQVTIQNRPTNMRCDSCAVCTDYFT